VEKIIDDVQYTGGVLASAEQSPHRLLYTTPELKTALHMSGTPVVTLRMAANKPAANLSVWLVSLPFDGKVVGSAGQLGVISRGWADPQNHKSLNKGGNYNSKEAGTPLVPGQFVDLKFDLQPGDRVIPAGKRLALMIMSSDREFTLWPKAGTELSIETDASSIGFPVVGGMSAIKAAFGIK
ncbi:MAG: hypothetical protein K2P84_14455, partial [Undibacterium sp.]|nr:hypothetical protein [Undibacterium sp.]